MSDYLGAVVDLFSGAGGMSYGFHTHPSFEIAGAADVEVGKPSTGHGAIGCNATYEENMKVRPEAIDLSAVDPAELAQEILEGDYERVRVLLACPPCTGFTRNVSHNWVKDDPRNSLVSRAADFAAEFQPDIVMMENVPQLLRGKFTHHYISLRSRLIALGYQVQAATHRFTRFGLPQQRERAVIIAVRQGLPLLTLEDLWRGYGVRPEALTVRRAIAHLPPVEAGATHPEDPNHTSTRLTGESLDRIRAMPPDGGDWPDLLGDPKTERYLIPSMWSAVRKGRLNEHCDVYGRMYWDRPAPTIKRECSHVGNGRYAHPSQDRQCTVREMAILQGFPGSYRFVGTSRKNLYRQIGDAVPPLLSFQLAWVAHWILTGERPDISEVVLEGTSLRPEDAVAAQDQLILSC